MGQSDKEPPLTEPLIVPCLYCTGAAVERVAHAVQVIFWTHTPALGEDDGERRISSRVAMPIDIARIFAKEITRALREGGH